MTEENCFATEPGCLCLQIFRFPLSLWMRHFTGHPAERLIKDGIPGIARRHESCTSAQAGQGACVREQISFPAEERTSGENQQATTGLQKGHDKSGE